MPFLPLFIPLVLKNWRALLIGAAVLFVAGWALRERSILIERGKDEATTEIEQANQEALRRANQAQDTVDGCYATGGDWDRVRGVCVGPTR